MKRLFGIAALGIASVGTSASILAESPKAASKAEPRLVVGIMIDQLRTDYLRQLSPLFGQGGFNRLMNDGLFITDADFSNTVGDAASGSAVAFTGAWPVLNGVSGAEVYDETKKRMVPALTGKTAGSYSPEDLRLTTIADELSLAGGGLSRIYSIAADPQVAVVLAGHAGSGAMWIDENTGRWTTSAYYNSNPGSVEKRNRLAPLSKKIESATWRPLLPADRYPIFTAGNRISDFNYTFRADNRDAYTNFKNSAPFNEEATNLAIELLKGYGLVADGLPTGMLNIAYTAAPISFDRDGDNRLELMDTYVRLDAQLERLLKEIDSKVGLDKTVIFLVSSGYAHEPAINASGINLPGGDFSVKKAESLLDSYLSAAHGNGDYVARMNGSRIYLDRKLIESKRLNLADIRREAKEFLLRMSGVQQAFTYDDILYGSGSITEDLAASLDHKNAADIYLQVTPGWTVSEDTDYPVRTYQVNYSNPLTPAFILAPGLLPKVVETPVDARAIAPTVTSRIHIRAPNGASEKPLF